MPYTRFSPRWNETKRRAIQLLAEVLVPYRDTTSWRHQLVTALYLRLLRETEYADPEVVKALQLIRLKRILKIAERIPFWHERLQTAGLGKHITSLQDLGSLQPVTKLSFRNTSWSELMVRFTPEHSRMLMQRTSGTTGIPFEWGVDKNTLWVETTSFFYRALSWRGIPLKRYARFPFIAAMIFKSYDAPCIEFHWNPVASDAEATFAHTVRTIRTKRMRILFAYPTNLLLYVKKLASLGLSLPIEAVVVTGQRIRDDERAYVESVLQCPFIALYGSREFGQMAIECPGRRHWYHINSERLFFEILDEDGCSVPDGEEGRITITSLENLTTPLLRYQLGDRGRLITEPCSCGRTLPLLEFFGRDTDYIILPNGGKLPFRQVNPIILWDFFDTIEHYQFLQTHTNRLRMRVKLKNGNLKEFEQRMIPKLRSVIGHELNIDFEYPEEWNFKENKIRLFIPLGDGAH